MDSFGELVIWALGILRLSKARYKEKILLFDDVFDLFISIYRNCVTSCSRLSLALHTKPVYPACAFEFITISIPNKSKPLTLIAWCYDVTVPRWLQVCQPWQAVFTAQQCPLFYRQLPIDWVSILAKTWPLFNGSKGPTTWVYFWLELSTQCWPNAFYRLNTDVHCYLYPTLPLLHPCPPSPTRPSAGTESISQEHCRKCRQNLKVSYGFIRFPGGII